MLSETEYRHQVEADIRPFRDVLLGLFFIFIGTLLDFPALADQIAVVSVVVLALIIGKTLIIWILSRYSLGGWRASLRAGLVLAQGGEFGIALLALALQEKALDQSSAQLLLAGIVISMVLSPLLIRHNRTIAGRLIAREDPETHRLALQQPATVAVAKRRHVHHLRLRQGWPEPGPNPRARGFRVYRPGSRPLSRTHRQASRAIRSTMGMRLNGMSSKASAWSMPAWS